MTEFKIIVNAQEFDRLWWHLKFTVNDAFTLNFMLPVTGSTNRFLIHKDNIQLVSAERFNKSELPEISFARFQISYLKELPKYYAIKYANKPLWGNFVEWACKYYDVSFSPQFRGYFGTYMTESGTISMKPMSTMDDVDACGIEITLEEWQEAVRFQIETDHNDLSGKQGGKVCKRFNDVYLSNSTMGEQNKYSVSLVYQKDKSTLLRGAIVRAVSPTEALGHAIEFFFKETEGYALNIKLVLDIDDNLNNQELESRILMTQEVANKK